jgi:hypothetical protein
VCVCVCVCVCVWKKGVLANHSVYGSMAGLGSFSARPLLTTWRSFVRVSSPEKCEMDPGVAVEYLCFKRASHMRRSR